MYDPQSNALLWFICNMVTLRNLISSHGRPFVCKLRRLFLQDKFRKVVLRILVKALCSYPEPRNLHFKVLKNLFKRFLLVSGAGKLLTNCFHCLQLFSLGSRKPQRDVAVRTTWS
jgi:hypothetical protein